MPPELTAAAATPVAGVSTVTTADDGWYRDLTGFAQHTAWLNGVMALYTVGAIVLLALMAGYAWWWARSRADLAAMAAVLWLGLGTVVCVGLGLGLKQVFKETRPCLVIHVATVQACPGATDYSFPSDHTTVAVALAVGLWLVNRKLGLVGAALALVEAFSRVYLGQHYPHDVLAAIVLSTAVMLLGWALLRRPLVRLVTALATTPVRPLLIGSGGLPSTAASGGAAPTPVGTGPQGRDASH
jgi:membrane-associated phospholipid phosphatase